MQHLKEQSGDASDHYRGDVAMHAPDDRTGREGGKTMTSVAMNWGVKPVCARPEFYSFLFRWAETMEALRGWDGVTNRATDRRGGFVETLAG